MNTDGPASPLVPVYVYSAVEAEALFEFARRSNSSTGCIGRLSGDSSVTGRPRRSERDSVGTEPRALVSS